MCFKYVKFFLGILDRTRDGRITTSYSFHFSWMVLEYHVRHSLLAATFEWKNKINIFRHEAYFLLKGREFAKNKKLAKDVVDT